MATALLVGRSESVATKTSDAIGDPPPATRVATSYRPMRRARLSGVVPTNTLQRKGYPMGFGGTRRPMALAVLAIAAALASADAAAAPPGKKKRGPATPAAA